jgi:hypothetical protein
MALAGLALIGGGALGGFRLAVETSITVAGSLVLATARLLNVRASRAPVASCGT